jgi:outer membrane protein assembly factor BamB
MSLATIARTAALVALFSTTGLAAPGDWPQWRGPTRENVSADTNLLKQWPAGGPKLLWEFNGLAELRGECHASVAIADNKLYTIGNSNKQGASLYCIDLDTRNVLFTARMTGNGPSNSTPTVSDGLAFALGNQGELICVKSDTGALVWKKHLQKDLGGGKTPGWNFSESPLVDGDKLIVTPGGEDALLVALNKKTGDVLWKTALPDNLRGKDAHAQHSTITIADAGGVKQYLTLIYNLGLVGVDASTGKFLWNYPRISNGTANIPTAVAHGDLVFCSTGYGTGAALLKLDGKTATEQYFLKSDTFQNHHGGFLRIGDHLYGGSGHNAGKPTCIELKTGKVLWQHDQLGKESGAVTAADGHLYFLWQDGTVAMIEATPAAYKLKGQFKLPKQSGAAWAHPVVTGGKLYLRWGGKVFCYDLKA